MALTKVSRELLNTSIVDNGNSTAITIDSSENISLTNDLYVGKTTGDINTNGLAFLSGFYLSVTRSNGSCVILNRQNSEGSIIDLRKNNNTIGYIGVDNSDNLVIEGNSSHSGLQFGSSAILPHQNFGLTDGTISLGSFTNRFKDIHSKGFLRVNDGQISVDGSHTVNLNLATIISKGSIDTTTGTNAQNYHITFKDAGNTTKGSIATSHSTTIYSTTSDYRLKEDIQPINNATATVLSLNPCNFKWKQGGARAIGFIAHELQELVPEAVTGEKDAMVTDEDGNESPEYQGVDQSKLVPLLVATIQELEARITELENS